MKRSLVLGFRLGALFTLGLVTQGCSSSGGGGSAGGATANAGSIQTGGTTSPSGGASSAGGTTTPSGGTTVASGGNATPSGGTTAASGGTITPSGGTTAASGGTPSGGTTSAGGTTRASGGTASSTGGAATGGTTSPTGGSTSARGGTTGATGGSTARTGGTTGVTGGSTSTAGGTTTAGGSTATGGTSRTGGTTVATGGTTTTTGGTTSASGNEYWISPTGKDTAAGTQADPLFTLCNDTLKTGACYKLCPVVSGATGSTCTSGTIWVMDGTYSYGSVTQKIGSSKLGTASAPLNVFAVAGAKPVFDFTGMPVATTSRGLQIGGDYWHIKGITVTKAGDSGIFVMGNNNTIEQCMAHHNQDMGIALGENSSRAGTPANNLILNCDSYQNNDTATNGENADGFGAKKNPGVGGNIFRGCRAWDNSDDGFDFYGWGSPITLDNCWAISQSKTTNGSNSDGNGFKLGGNSVSAAHILKDLYAADNNYGSNGCGFTNNSNPASMSCSGSCASWGNKKADQGVSGVSTTAPSGATAQKMIDAKRNADGSLPAITSL